MSVTYTDQVRPAAARIDSDAYVPVYARGDARKSNKPVKTWMILAPLGVLVVGGAAAAMLMQPAEPVAPTPLDAAPVAPVATPLTAPTIPMETPAPSIPPPDAALVERRATPARAARIAPRVAPAPAPVVEAPVPMGPQPYLSVAPQTAAPTAVAPAAVTPTAPPAPIVITPPN
jgi:hypothetical protein